MKSRLLLIAFLCVFTLSLTAQEGYASWVDTSLEIFPNGSPTSTTNLVAQLKVDIIPLFLQIGKSDIKLTAFGVLIPRDFIEGEDDMSIYVGPIGIRRHFPLDISVDFNVRFNLAPDEYFNQNVSINKYFSLRDQQYFSIGVGSQKANSYPIGFFLKATYGIGVNYISGIKNRNNNDKIRLNFKNKNKNSYPVYTNKKPKPTPRVVKAPVEKEKDALPPIITIEKSAIEFKDKNLNNKIDALENSTIEFRINNKGKGSCNNCKVKTKITGDSKGITYDRVIDLPQIKPNKSFDVSIPLSTSRFTENGQIIIEIEIVEPKGFAPTPIEMAINTNAFANPKIEVVDFTSVNLWKSNNPISLDLLIQNVGQGIAEEVVIEIIIPDNVNCYSGNTTKTIAKIFPGETVTLTYDLLISRTYSNSIVLIEAIIDEKHKDYGSKWEHSFTFESDENANRIVVESTEEETEIQIQKGTFNNNAADVSFNQVPKDIVVNTVAVLPIDGIDCNGKTVSGQDIASFTEGALLGLYNVVERRNLERVLDEQKLALSGILFEKSAVEAGCNVGAQGIIFTEYGCLTGQEVIQLKLVDCQTSELYWSATGINATATQVLDKVREELEKE